MSITRKRLSPDESRYVALEAARTILLEAGPQAVTLKAVAERVGRTHANLLHHFGSAAGLQEALIGMMADRIVDEIAVASKRARATDHNPREVVDLTFDAFAQGAGALASWMILSGNTNALDPVLKAIQRLVDDLAHDHPHEGMSLQEETLQLVLTALGDALLGAPMAAALGLRRDKARELATQSMLAAHAHLLPK